MGVFKKVAMSLTPTPPAFNGAMVSTYGIVYYELLLTMFMSYLATHNNPQLIMTYNDPQ